MNDNRSESTDAEPPPVTTQITDAMETPVNSQITDAVQTGTHTKLGAIPASYGEAGGMADEGEPSED